MLSFPSLSTQERKALAPWIVGGVIILLICVGVFVLIVSGKTRRVGQAPSPEPQPVSVATTTTLVARRLDGEFVSETEAALAPWAIMIDHQVAARPQSGVSAARVVIEAPVEGGITRLMGLFAPTSTLSEVGPVRSARPCFVEWADAWKATYIHVGGSPEALERIRSWGARFHDVNEMSADGWAFWRAPGRTAPHSVVTNGDRLWSLAERKGFASSTMPVAWHFLPEATSTEPGGVSRISVPYGGSHSVIWKFNRERAVYERFLGTRAVKDQDGSAWEVQNVIVMKTDAQVLDEQGRLKVRTTGSGEAVAYRDGNKYVIRWRRSPGEPMRFETVDGVEFLLRRGKTWIQVTTDDKTFAGLET